MKVSIVVPAKNEEAIIGDCLESILLQTVRPREVIVVDNASTDNTRACIDAFAARFKKKEISLVVLTCINGNQIEARGMAFRTAKHEIIGTIDADTTLSRTWVEETIRCFESDADIVGMGGSITYNDSVVAFLHWWVFTVYRIFPKNYFFYGCNGAFRRSVYHQIPRVEECRILMEQYHLHEPYDDLFLSFQLKKYGKVVQWRSALAFARSRTTGQPGSFVGALCRSSTQFKESLFLQKLLKP